MTVARVEFGYIYTFFPWTIYSHDNQSWFCNEGGMDGFLAPGPRVLSEIPGKMAAWLAKALVLILFGYGG